jgi:hypothetical protein
MDSFGGDKPNSPGLKLPEFPGTSATASPQGDSLVVAFEAQRILIPAAVIPTPLNRIMSTKTQCFAAFRSVTPDHDVSRFVV